MRKLLVGVAVFCLLAPAIAVAWTSKVAGRAIVLSIDVKTQSMTVKRESFDEWTETSMTWNEKTKWTQRTEGEDEVKPATPALANTLKSGSKVYISATDDVLEEVRALPLSTEVK